MSRTLRHFQSGGIYHIIHRGHNKFHIFEESVDKAVFLDILKKVIAETGGYVLYYTIMDNHYHILIEMQDTPLDLIMQRINCRYAHYYSAKIKMSGSVFGSRFDSQDVSNRKYLTAVIQYIAINPIKAGLVQKIPDYRWCAHAELVNRKQEVLASQRLFELLGETSEQGKTVYTALMGEAQKKIDLSATIDISRPARKINMLEDQLLSFLASYDRKMTLIQIRTPTRNRDILEARRSFAQIAHEQGYAISDIARVLGVSVKSVYNWCNENKILKARTITNQSENNHGSRRKIITDLAENNHGSRHRKTILSRVIRSRLTGL